MWPDLLTLNFFLVAWALVIAGYWGSVYWITREHRRRHQRDLERVDQVRAQMRDRRESLRKAAATEYSRRTDRR